MPRFRLSQFNIWHLVWLCPLAAVLLHLIWQNTVEMWLPIQRDPLERVTDSVEAVLLAVAIATVAVRLIVGQTFVAHAERDKLDRVASGLGVGLYLVDRDFHIQWVNRAIEKRFGPLKNLQGRTCHEVFWNEPDVCPTCPRRFSKEGVDAIPFEKTQVDRRGVKRFYELINFPITDPNGRTSQFLELVQDTSRTMSLLQNIKERESEISELFEDSKDAIFVSDLETGHILLTNPEFQRLLGYTRLQLQTTNVGELLTSAEAAGVRELLDRVAKQGSVTSLPMSFIRSDGGRVVLDCSAALTTFRGRRSVITSGRARSPREKVA